MGVNVVSNGGFYNCIKYGLLNLGTLYNEDRKIFNRILLRIFCRLSKFYHTQYCHFEKTFFMHGFLVPVITKYNPFLERIYGYGYGYNRFQALFLSNQIILNSINSASQLMVNGRNNEFFNSVITSTSALNDRSRNN